MKKLIFKCSLILSLVFIMGSTIAAECRTGGVGSSSCTYGYSFLWGLIGETYSVSCGDCYYACCTMNSGSCKAQYSDDPTSPCHPDNHPELAGPK